MAGKEVLAQGLGQKVEAVMTSEVAVRYINTEINPILAKVANDPSQIPGIKNRLIEQFKATVPGGKMMEGAMRGFRPGVPDSVAHLDYDAAQKKPFLMIFVPALQKMKRDLEWSGYKTHDIETIIGLIFAHEQVHYEIDELQKKYPIEQRVGKNNPDLEAREEAEAWGITILEMIRPALEKKIRLPQYMVDNSAELKRVGDDYHNPAWVYAFRTKPQGIK